MFDPPVDVCFYTAEPDFNFEYFKRKIQTAIETSNPRVINVNLNGKHIVSLSYDDVTFMYPHLSCGLMTLHQIWVGINNVRDYELPYKTTITGYHLPCEDAAKIISSGIEVSMVSGYVEVKTEEDCLQLMLLL